MADPVPFIVAPWQQPTSVSSVLVVPPVAEPLSLDEAKLRAGLFWPTTTPADPRDALMAEHIAAARQQVELDTGLALLTQTRELQFAADVTVLPLPMHALPLQAITDGAGQPIDPATFTFDPSTYTVRWQRTVTPPIRIVSGWLDAETLKAQAPLLYHAVALLTAHYATRGRDLTADGQSSAVAVMPYGYEAAIAPYKLVWVP